MKTGGQRIRRPIPPFPSKAVAANNRRRLWRDWGAGGVLLRRWRVPSVKRKLSPAWWRVKAEGSRGRLFAAPGHGRKGETETAIEGEREGGVVAVLVEEAAAAAVTLWIGRHVIKINTAVWMPLAKRVCMCVCVCVCRSVFVALQAFPTFPSWGLPHMGIVFPFEHKHALLFFRRGFVRIFLPRLHYINVDVEKNLNWMLWLNKCLPVIFIFIWKYNFMHFIARQLIHF